MFDGEDESVKGRDRFTAGEAEAIGDVLRKLRCSEDRNEQKKLRRILRRHHCFYITDFDRSGAGFTTADFENLIQLGTITVDRN